MDKRQGVSHRVLGSGRVSSIPDMDPCGCRRPQPYCFAVPREPLRYPRAPTICNVIMVPAELRCSHPWLTGVDPGLFVKHIMPKLDSAASEHNVWSEKFLDNYVFSGEELTATWGCCVKTACARALLFCLLGYLMVQEARLLCMMFYTFLLCVLTSSLCMRCS